jgi:hypothetical protein
MESIGADTCSVVQTDTLKKRNCPPTRSTMGISFGDILGCLDHNTNRSASQRFMNRFKRNRYHGDSLAMLPAHRRVAKQRRIHTFRTSNKLLGNSKVSMCEITKERTVSIQGQKLDVTSKLVTVPAVSPDHRMKSNSKADQNSGAPSVQNLDMVDDLEIDKNYVVGNECDVEQDVDQKTPAPISGTFSPSKIDSVSTEMGVQHLTSELGPNGIQLGCTPKNSVLESPKENQKNAHGLRRERPLRCSKRIILLDSPDEDAVYICPQSGRQYRLLQLHSEDE